MAIFFGGGLERKTLRRDGGNKKGLSSFISDNPFVEIEVLSRHNAHEVSVENVDNSRDWIFNSQRDNGNSASDH